MIELCIILIQAQDKNVVIIGGSFIGMEVACFLATISTNVTVCCRQSVPFELGFGNQVIHHVFTQVYWYV